MYHLHRLHERQALWGTRGTAYGGWTLLSDGEQGLKQLVPLAWKALSIPSSLRHSISYQKNDGNALTAALIDSDGAETSVVGWRPARLVVRQTLEYDRDGIATVKHARCVRIEWEQESADEQPT